MTHIPETPELQLDLMLEHAELALECVQAKGTAVTTFIGLVLFNDIKAGIPGTSLDIFAYGNSNNLAFAMTEANKAVARQIIQRMLKD